MNMTPTQQPKYQAPESDKEIIKASIHEAIEKFGQEEFAAALTEVTAEILAAYREQREQKEENESPKRSVRFEEARVQVLDALNMAYLSGHDDGTKKTQGPFVCCGKYHTCQEACTPRGKFLAEKAKTEAETEKVRVINGVIHTLEWTPQVMMPTTTTSWPMERETCDHSWKYEGHSHNSSLYICSKCKEEEWR